MDKDNAEVVRDISAAVRRYWQGKGRWLELVAPFFDPSVDYYPVRKWPESRPCHGVDELDRFFAGMADGFREMDWDIHSIEAVGDDRVLLHCLLRSEGRGSGMELDGDLYICYWLRHGLVFRQEDHLTRGGARHALGLDA